MSLSVDIRKNYGSFQLRVRLEAQGLTGLLGESGCGKTLTLQCVAGIHRPDEGKIVLNGVTLFDSRRGIDLPPQKRQVGYLFQSYALFPHLTVDQNILCGLYGERDKGQKQNRVREIERLLGLESMTRHRPSQLSGGQAQRVALARILVGNPQLLLLDEPFSALDSLLRERLQRELLEVLRSFGKDVLLVTHSREEAFGLCEELAVMDRGQILIQKPTSDLIKSPEKKKAAMLMGCRNIVPARKRGATAVEIPSWGKTLETGRSVPEDLTAIGIYETDFEGERDQNTLDVRILREAEEPFGWVQELCVSGQAPSSPYLWRKVPKTGGIPRHPSALSLPPERILLLTEDEAMSSWK